MRLILLLLFLCGPAQAAPSCIPGFYGDEYPGTRAIGPIRGDDGWYAFGWCREAATGKPFSVYRLCAHGECASDLSNQIGSGLMTLGAKLIGSDPKTVYGGWWDTNPPGYDCDKTTGPQVTAPSTPRGKACAELQALLSKYGPTIAPPLPSTPPAPTYAVKANGTSTTRPAYMLTNGVRGTTSVGRAEVGRPCDVKKPTLASGSDLWAEFGPAFESGKVALCAKNP